MNQPTVESLFGANAGIVWKTLNKNGPSNLARLVKSTSLSREEVFGTLGWLAVKTRSWWSRKVVQWSFRYGMKKCVWSSPKRLLLNLH